MQPRINSVLLLVICEVEVDWSAQFPNRTLSSNGPMAPPKKPMSTLSLSVSALTGAMVSHSFVLCGLISWCSLLHVGGLLSMEMCGLGTMLVLTPDSPGGTT